MNGEMKSEPILRTTLRSHRRAAGLIQQALAETVGVSRKTINKIEGENYIPSTLLSIKLASALKMEIETLFWLET